jgi:hypothetical protein
VAGEHPQKILINVISKLDYLRVGYPWRDHLLPPKIFFNQRRLANESHILPTNALKDDDRW